MSFMLKELFSGSKDFDRGHFQNTPNFKTLFGYALLTMNLKLEILARFKFSGHQICQQTAYKRPTFKRLHFQLKSEREG